MTRRRKRRCNAAGRTRLDYDSLLAPHQFRELNERFYGARPYSYLSQRLYSLLFMLQDPRTDAEESNPICVGAVRVTPGALREDDERAIDYAAIEATVLLHHATEALFRLYFAHVGDPACPWLEASRLLMGEKYWKKLNGLLDSIDQPETRSDVLRVFRGVTSWERARGGFTGTEEQWNTAVEGLICLLTVVGKRLSAESKLYNSAKHGLAVVSGELGMELGNPGAPIIATQGPSVQILSKGANTHRWSRVATWVHVDGTIAMIHLVIQEIEALFNVARRRYLGVTEPVGLPLVTREMIDRLVAPSVQPDEQGTRFIPTSLAEELVYYLEPIGTPKD